MQTQDRAVIPKHTLDPSIISTWTDRCSRYRAKTRWVRPVAFLAIFGAIALLMIRGVDAIPYALALFAAGTLVAGVVVSRYTPLLMCPHCGHRPVSLRGRYRSPLYAKHCEHCYYWLMQPATPYG